MVTLQNFEQVILSGSPKLNGTACNFRKADANEKSLIAYGYTTEFKPRIQFDVQIRTTGEKNVFDFYVIAESKYGSGIFSEKLEVSDLTQITEYLNEALASAVYNGEIDGILGNNEFEESKEDDTLITTDYSNVGMTVAESAGAAPELNATLEDFNFELLKNELKVFGKSVYLKPTYFGEQKLIAEGYIEDVQDNYDITIEIEKQSGNTYKVSGLVESQMGSGEFQNVYSYVEQKEVKDVLENALKQVFEQSGELRGVLGESTSRAMTATDLENALAFNTYKLGNHEFTFDNIQWVNDNLESITNFDLFNKYELVFNFSMDDSTLTMFLKKENGDPLAFKAEFDGLEANHARAMIENALYDFVNNNRNHEYIKEFTEQYDEEGNVIKESKKSSYTPYKNKFFKLKESVELTDEMEAKVEQFLNLFDFGYSSKVENDGEGAFTVKLDISDAEFSTGDIYFPSTGYEPAEGTQEWDDLNDKLTELENELTKMTKKSVFISEMDEDGYFTVKIES